MSENHRFLGTSLAIYCSLSLFFVGCAVGPNYKRPPINLPDNFRGAPGVTSTNSLAELPWWEIYKDETLTELIHIALTNNYDLRLAVTRVEQARAIAAQTRSQFFPWFNYDGIAGRNRNHAPAAVGAGGTINPEALAVVNAMWELDFWGRIRRLNESDRARFFASEEARRNVMITLIGDVATAYFELLELDDELEIARRTTDSYAGSLKIFSQRLEGGVASILETSSAEAALASTAANIPDLERRIALQENQISVLLGRNPESITRKTMRLQQAMLPGVPAGLPSALLERRPDVRQAEQLLRAANAEIGVSIAEFFPTIDLTALLGRVSPELTAFTAGAGNTWSIAVNVTGPIFQGGRLRAQYRQARAAWQEAKLSYEQSTLTALREVSDALIAREKLESVRSQQVRSVLAYREAVKVSTQRYMAGRASYYEVLQAQQQLYPAEILLARTQLNQLLAVVQLYRALGGGWHTEHARLVGTH